MPVEDTKLQWRNKFLTDLQELVADMVAEFDLQAILQRAVEKIAELVGADIVTIHIHDLLTGQVQVAAGHGLLDWEEFQQHHRPGRGKAVLLVVNKGEPIIAEDASTSELAGPFSAREGVRSAAGFPLKAGDQVIGVLFVSYRIPHRFELEQVETLVSFGNLAGVAIQNARLLRHERSLRQQAETLRSVSAAVSSALGLKEVAERILDELGKVIEYHKATMQLIRGNSRTLLARRGFGEKDVNEWLLRPISEDRLISRIAAAK